MKKMIALMMLCLLLCVMCATAMAAKIEFGPGIKDYTGSVADVDAVDGKVKLPACGFSPTEEDEFVGWYVAGKLYYPDETVKIYKNEKAKAVWKSQKPSVIEYTAGRGTTDEKARVLYYDGIGGRHEVFGNDSFGFIAPENEAFVGWLLTSGEGNKWELPDLDDEEPLGWLFARAIAEENKMFYKDDYIIAESEYIILEAQWSSDANAGGNNGGGNGGNGGNNGGNNGGGNGGGNGAAAGMPSTGDNSLRLDFLFLVMAASLCGLRLMAKKRIN